MKYTVLARYSAMRTIGTFSTTIKNLRFGHKCILRTGRGTEWGEVTSDLQPSDTASAAHPDGIILRRAATDDYERRRQIDDIEQPKEFDFCADKIAARNLPMRLASVEHIFGGEKIIFYFLADGRVDFRQLVKDLAAEYRTRIEMRQIGARDEARLLTEYGHCGRELCCRTFIRELEPVTMRMAKLQKTTLDPAKISGRCGRLMCCLRFEDETYAELRKNLPQKGSRVRLKQGVGEVISSEILAQTLTVELSDKKTTTVGLSEVLETLPEEKSQKPETQQDSRGSGRNKARNGRKRPQKTATTPDETQQEQKKHRQQTDTGPGQNQRREHETTQQQLDAPPQDVHDELAPQEWWEEPDNGEE